MKKLALMGILSVLAIGCGDDDGGRSGTDSGMLTLMDSGTIVLPDTGTTPTPDAGSGTCPPEQIPGVDMAACTEQQIMDLQTAAGMGDAALQAWFDANAACGACALQGIYSCATMNGCDDEWGNVICCIDSACSSSTTQAEFDACANAAQNAGGACGDEATAFYSTCTGGLPMGTCGIDPACIM